MPNPSPDKEELKIFNAAVDLFARKGFAGATVSQIAKKAGVPGKAVYHHFHTKKALLSSLLEKIWQKLADEMIDLAENEKLDPLEKIDKMVVDTVDIFAENPKLASVFFNEYNPILSGKNDSLNAHFVNYLKAFAEIFNKGLQQQFINPVIDGRVFLFFIHGGLRNVIQEWAMHPKIFNLKKIKENIKYQIKHGIIKW
jgi:TetR/AcrR family fatty acid metabolism transcriptional regulator